MFRECQPAGIGQQQRRSGYRQGVFAELKAPGDAPATASYSPHFLLPPLFLGGGNTYMTDAVFGRLWQ